jgi:hypothetical protein
LKIFEYLNVIVEEEAVTKVNGKDMGMGRYAFQASMKKHGEQFMKEKGWVEGKDMYEFLGEKGREGWEVISTFIYTSEGVNIGTKFFDSTKQVWIIMKRELSTEGTA